MVIAQKIMAVHRIVVSVAVVLVGMAVEERRLDSRDWFECDWLCFVGLNGLMMILVVAVVVVVVVV